MISTLVRWPAGPVRLRWVPRPRPHAEPVTAVHCFCFAQGQLVLVHVAGRGPSIPGGHVDPGESPAVSLRRELAEEACIAVNEPTLLGAVECDHSENPRFEATGYPRIASQLLYAAVVSDVMPFVPSDEVLARMLVPVAQCPQRHHEWNAVLQAALDDAVSVAGEWRDGA